MSAVRCAVLLLIYYVHLSVAREKYGLFVIGSNTVSDDTYVSGTPVWEISGLSFSENSCVDIGGCVYYGVSDSIGHDFNKSIFNFSFDVENENVAISAIQLEEPPNYIELKWLDSENIVRLNDSFIIASEGYRQFGTFTNFLIYDDDGRYIGNISYNTDVFQERNNSGFVDGDGIESMSVTSDGNTLVFIGSNTLVQDDCDHCVRISVNNINRNSGYGHGFNEMFQFRYDKDSDDTSRTVGDATIIKDDLSIILVLEKFENYDGTVDVNIYQIDLSDKDSNYDIKDCWSLNEADCDNYDMVINKTFVRNLGELDIPNATYIDFEAISRGGDVDIDGCDGTLVVAASDNGEEGDTYFVYLCFQQNDTTFISTEIADGAIMASVSNVLVAVSFYLMIY